LALAGALAAMVPSHGMADTIVSTSQSGISNSSTQNITVTSSGSISGGNFSGIGNTDTINTLSNSGSIASTYNAIDNTGASSLISTLSNGGTHSRCLGRAEIAAVTEQRGDKALTWFINLGFEARERTELLMKVEPAFRLHQDIENVFSGNRAKSCLSM
jgi:hypothetical protein